MIIIKESDWSIESNSNESSGAYEVDSLVTGGKWVVARKSDGEALGYGNVTPAFYTPPSRGVCGGGEASILNTMDYVTIDTTGNATDFGDLTYGIQGHSGATSNGTSERGIWMGGSRDSASNNTVDYITISSTGNAADFGDLTVARSDTMATSNA